MAKRVFLIVLDSCGIGASPDAALFNDAGANTMKSISQSAEFNIENLKSLGFTKIDGLSYLGDGNLKATVARLQEKSRGKDTTIGHWELAGIISQKPLPTFPEGFPQEVLVEFSRLTKRGVLCNKPYSGTEVIKDFGEEHLKTGSLIVYTSADSVFQIAAHESVVPPETLYEYCKIARSLLTGDLGVGRVIARPFEGEYPFKRTSRRHDFSLQPPKATVLDELKNNGYDVIGVGKINDIFAGKGITEYTYTKNNEEGMEKALLYSEKSFNGLCFINLVDFDMKYGHRQDAVGYANALNEFDAWLGKTLPALRDDDTLIITADHGCDPCDNSTDHTREYVPFFVYRRNTPAKNLGTMSGFDNVAHTVYQILENK
jgi:phosphopentomutase